MSAHRKNDIGYLNEVSEKTINFYKSLEEQIDKIVTETNDLSQERIRNNYQQMMTQIQIKKNELGRVYRHCDIVDNNITKIRGTLHNISGIFDKITSIYNKSILSGLQYLSSDVVKKHYDIENNEYIKEIFKNIDILESSNKTGGKNRTKFNKKNKSNKIRKNKTNKNKKNK